MNYIARAERPDAEVSTRQNYTRKEITYSENGLGYPEQPDPGAKNRQEHLKLEVSLVARAWSRREERRGHLVSALLALQCWPLCRAREPRGYRGWYSTATVPEACNSVSVPSDVYPGLSSLMCLTSVGRSSSQKGRSKGKGTWNTIIVPD